MSPSRATPLQLAGDTENLSETKKLIEDLQQEVLDNNKTAEESKKELVKLTSKIIKFKQDKEAFEQQKVWLKSKYREAGLEKQFN